MQVTRLIASLIIVSALAPCASAQLVQTWDTKAREKSQRLNSAGTTALDKGQIAQAIILLNQAIAADPTDHVALNTLGVALAKQGKYDEALEHLQKAYALKHDAETLLSTGMVYYLQHDFDAAIKSWTRALELDPKMIALHGNMGYAYLRKGDFEKAEESFHKLIKVKPNSTLAYKGLALTKYLSGEVSSAMKLAEHARTLAPNSAPLLLILAKLDFIQGNADSGKARLREWQKAIVAKKGVTPFAMTSMGYPVQHDFHWDIFAADHFDNGNFLLARTRILPKEEGSRRSYASKGKMTIAMAAAKSAAEADPEDYFVLRELGLLELANADYNSAADHFAKVLQLCPSCRIDWLHLARAQFLGGKPNEAAYAAREYFRQLPEEKISSVFSSLAATAKDESAAPPQQSTPAAAKKQPAEAGGTGF